MDLDPPCLTPATNYAVAGRVTGDCRLQGHVDASDLDTRRGWGLSRDEGAGMYKVIMDGGADAW